MSFLNILKAIRRDFLTVCPGLPGEWGRKLTASLQFRLSVAICPNCLPAHPEPPRFRYL